MLTSLVASELNISILPFSRDGDGDQVIYPSVDIYQTIRGGKVSYPMKFSEKLWQSHL